MVLGKAWAPKGQRMPRPLPASCRVRPVSPVPQAPVTLPSAIPNLPEAAALTEPVQALLLDQLKDLRLDLLPQLPGVDMHRGKEVTAKLWKKGRAGTASPACHLHDWWGLEVVLAHPLGLAQPQNLRVAQAAQFALELIQRVGLRGQSARDLFSDNLHNLRGEEEGSHLAPAPRTDGLPLAPRLALARGPEHSRLGELSTAVLRHIFSDGF